jgi:hypothetical protein
MEHLSGEDFRIISPSEFFKIASVENDLNYQIPYNINSLDEEITELNNEITSGDISPLKWDKGDYLTVFISGILGGLADIFVGMPGGYKEINVKNNSFLGLGEQLKNYDLSNNIIDTQIPNTSLGDHRLYSYGHDLFRFTNASSMIKNGEGVLGIIPSFGEMPLISLDPTPSNEWDSAIILLLHLFKDFWTKRSLPLPGSTAIANLNNNEMPEIIRDLYRNHEVNLRQLTGQLLSVTVIELTIRIWLYFTYRKTNVPKDKISSKKNKMLLLGHSVGMLFNTGKVLVTQNPFLINIPQLIRIMYLGFKVLKDNTEITQKAITRANLAVYKNKIETLKTLIILDKAVVFTRHSIQSIMENKRIFENQFLSNESDADLGFKNINEMLNNFTRLNKKLGGN